MTFVTRIGRWVPGGYVRVVCTAVETRVNGPCARTLELPPSKVWPFFSFLFLLGVFFGVFSASILGEEIPDYMAHSPFIRVFMVRSDLSRARPWLRAGL